MIFLIVFIVILFSTILYLNGNEMILYNMWLPANVLDDWSWVHHCVLQRLDDVTRSLVLALGVCYHACLQNREAYRNCVATHFQGNLELPNGARTILDEINR